MKKSVLAISEMMETKDFIKIVDSLFPNDIDYYYKTTLEF